MRDQEANKLSYKISNVIIALTMCMIIFITFYPLYYTIVSSFSDARALLRHQGMLFAPLEPVTLDGYLLVFKNPNILSSFMNTLFYVVVGTTISLTLTIFGAYIVSRKYFLPRNFIMKSIMITMFFGGGLIPLFFVVQKTGIYNTRWAMILPYAISTYNLIVMRSFFVSIPESLEESALLDGANDFVILVKIFLPLSKPVLAVIGLYYAVGYWNSWYPSLVFQKDRTLYPLQMILRELLVLNDLASTQNAAEMVSEPYTRELVKYCTIVVSTVPILVLYPFLQKYFVKGVLIGSIKG